MVSLLLEILGILYLIFILREPQVIKKDNEQNDENPLPEQLKTNLELKVSNEMKESSEMKKNEPVFIVDKILDALRKVVIVLMRRRNGKGRLLVWLLLFCSFLCIGCDNGKIM